MQLISETVNKKFPGQRKKETGIKILMAEDNMVNQKLALLLFKKLGQEVEIVSNGREAVDAATTKHYDLIFMDIQMPELDGVEASRLIRQKLGSKTPVLIALTANAMQGDKEKYLNAGMDHYLSKPISMEDLKMYVKKYVFE